MTIQQVGEKLFFILYDARSGSTYLSNQLVSRYRVSIPPETNFVTLLIEHQPKWMIETIMGLHQAIEIVRSDPKFEDLGLLDESIKHNIEPSLPVTLSQFILSLLALYRDCHDSDAIHCGIKKGSYVYYLNSIRRLFPSARFLCLIRDGRAVFHSKKNSRYSVTGRRFTTDPMEAAKVWKERINLMRELERLGACCHMVRYENLITDTHRSLDEIGAFLGLVRAENPRPNYTISDRYDSDLHRNIHQPPLAERIDSWRQGLSAEEIDAFEAIAGAELAREGYSLVLNEHTPQNAV